jgi:hypothetical protein
MAKCTYCKCQIADGSAIEVCDICGVKVWGQKMFNAIKSNMEDARSRGDLEQGSV